MDEQVLAHIPPATLHKWRELLSPATADGAYAVFRHIGIILGITTLSVPPECEIPDSSLTPQEDVNCRGCAYQRRCKQAFPATCGCRSLLKDTVRVPRATLKSWVPRLTSFDDIPHIKDAIEEMETLLN